MSIPLNTYLPANAKYYAFVDDKLSYNPHWDINWSFEYALSGAEYGFCTFLTNFVPVTGFPGHYLGYSGNANLSSYLVTESDEYILTENGEKILIDSEDGIGSNGLLAIAFDSTGLFALSSLARGGVGLGSIRRDSLVIRDQDDNLVTNVQLSSLTTDFILGSSGGFNYQTLRFRYSQAGNKLSIDYKPEGVSEFISLTSIVTRLVFPYNYSDIYTGLSFCSPISSLNTPAIMKLRNFHTQGNISDETSETTQFIPITSSRPTTFVVLSSLSSN